MKYLTTYFLFTVLSLCTYAQISVSSAQGMPDDNGYIVRDGDMAPDFDVQLADGSHVRLSSLRGRIVMLQFTASWCSVCRKEMPFIERDIWQKHKDDAAFMLVGIDRDEPLETVKAFAQQTGVTYPMALDPDADVFGLYADKKAGVTRNVLIGRDGHIIKRTRLYKTDEFAELTQAIDSLLAKPAFTNLTTTDFSTCIARDDVQLVDVRTMEEWNEAHINEAVNIDVLQDNFVSRAERMLDRKKIVAVYCRSGKRSTTAAEKLTEAGFDVINLLGGFLEWTKKK